MNISFSNKVVAVTGGAKGIGGATASSFLEAGARVAVLDVDDAAGEERIEGHGQKALFVHCDVSDSTSAAEAFDRIAGHFGGVDVLVNNAGIQRYSSVTETTDEEWDLVIGVNLTGAFLCARSAIPSMLERGGGVVINVASVQAMYAHARSAPYVVSKTAMIGLTRSIAVDYAPSVRSVAVCPGTVHTPMLDKALERLDDPGALIHDLESMHLAGRIADPSEIADLILYLASDRASFITGQAYRIDGGLGVEIVGGGKQ